MVPFHCINLIFQRCIFAVIEILFIYAKFVLSLSFLAQERGRLAEDPITP